MYTLYIGNKNYSSWSLRGWLATKLSGAPFREVLVQLQGVGPNPAEMVEGPKLHGAIPNRGCQCLQAAVLLLLGCIGLGGAEGRWLRADRPAGREVLAQPTRPPARGRRSPGRRLDPGDHELVFHPEEAPTFAADAVGNRDQRALSFAVGAWNWRIGRDQR